MYYKYNETSWKGKSLEALKFPLDNNVCYYNDILVVGCHSQEQFFFYHTHIFY